MYSTLIIILSFLALISPIFTGKRIKDFRKQIIVNLLNIIIPLYLFTSHLEALFVHLNLITNDFSNYVDYIYSQVGFFSPIIRTISWIIYLLFCIYIPIQSVKLAYRRNDARRILIRYLPLMWILKSTLGYQDYIYFDNLASDEISFLIILLFTYGLLCISIYVVYISKFMRKIFTVSNCHPII